jgi:hypothetical protein
VAKFVKRKGRRDRGRERESNLKEEQQRKIK